MTPAQYRRYAAEFIAAAGLGRTLVRRGDYAHRVPSAIDWVSQINWLTMADAVFRIAADDGMSAYVQHNESEHAGVSILVFVRSPTHYAAVPVDLSTMCHRETDWWRSQVWWAFARPWLKKAERVGLAELEFMNPPTRIVLGQRGPL